MLSGKVPFQRWSRDDSASTIMHRIKDGNFSMASQEWEMVSEAAKRLIQGE